MLTRQQIRYIRRALDTGYIPLEDTFHGCCLYRKNTLSVLTEYSYLVLDKEEYAYAEKHAKAIESGYPLPDIEEDLL